MIIISTTTEDEARDLDEILAGIAWPYRIYLQGREFRPPEIAR